MEEVELYSAVVRRRTVTNMEWYATEVEKLCFACCLAISSCCFRSAISCLYFCSRAASSSQTVSRRSWLPLLSSPERSRSGWYFYCWLGATLKICCSILRGMLDIELLMK